MTQTVNFERPKLTETNTTGMVIKALASERGDTLVDPTHVLSGGSSAGITAKLTVDIDESGGTDEQDWFLIDLQASINDTSGAVTLVATVTPVKGDESGNHASQTHTFTHPETMDAFQTAGGRARQA